MYQCMCESMSLGRCPDCVPPALPFSIDLGRTRAEARPDLLAIHDRLIEASRGFADLCQVHVSPNAQAPRPRLTRRRKLVTDVVPGWSLGREVGSAAQIVLLPTGEIFCDSGLPRLTPDELTSNHWEIAGWFTNALDTYRFNGWPSGLEDPRRLAVEFHVTAASQPGEVRDPVAASSRSRLPWKRS